MNGLNASYIDSARLRLVPATADITRADLDGPEALARRLGLDVPAEWPPELYSRHALQLTLALLADASHHGWTNWYLATRGGQGVSTLAGVCGFKGRPDGAGSVEITYSLLPAFQGQGLASEAVSRLVEWAFSHPRVNEVSAETFPHLRRSIAVLRRNGFMPAGKGSEYGVVRYVISRSNLA
ncbi:GNAT family N-acetyltransferase [Marinihelvus fidelis]|uniref:GNAT family N-acetyltransferase n=1 Tax=Marinihelvus fidelis TaxID=2613842 RepID=UPI00177D62F5|nr:GNAT family N-acetyltransferase [Marinihelvus fidelis]